MPELFLELFSEEIPARLQARGAADLQRLLSDALAPLTPSEWQNFHGPRRIAVAANVAAGVAAVQSTERGPRVTAPEAALAGFLRKHNAAREDLRAEGDFWVLVKSAPPIAAADLIAAALPNLLRRFPWAKSMRWGGTSAFTWVRPLRRILCLLDGATVPFSMAAGDDDGHGLASSNLTEGHRFMAPGGVAVTGLADWQATLRDRFVVPAAAERERLIEAGIAARAAEAGATVVDDPGLVSEVAGLVEWPVPLLGRIDAAFMDLPAEVMQVSMRVNQRYFATRWPSGAAAPYFGFAANIDAADGGAAIVAGNERVLRARFADARHFWDLDRKTKLADRVAALDAMTFQAALGTQGARVRRLVRLAEYLAPLVGADADMAGRAALLAKADLTTGMVGEFPELQGVMGGYYARHDGEAPEVADAVRDHYLPKGPTDTVPVALVTVAVALADKLDQLAAFFAIGEKPTGSGDPFALRRAALGVIRILRESALRLPLRATLEFAADGLDGAVKTAETPAQTAAAVLEFVADRLKVQLRGEGARHDVLAAVFAAGGDDDLVRLLARSQAVAGLLETEDGTNLLAAYKRAANILRIEDRKDGPHEGAVDSKLMQQPEEHEVAAALEATKAAERFLSEERFGEAVAVLASLRAPLDAFFTAVMVNADDPDVRLNRLRLLAGVRGAINKVADFLSIES
jgi:glycyl-tRNA synthetase beta chain